MKSPFNSWNDNYRSVNYIKKCLPAFFLFFTCQQLSAHTYISTTQQKKIVPTTIYDYSSTSKLIQNERYGRVVDELGKPIQGATIKVKNSTTSTLTDKDGGFSVPIIEGGTLMVSAVGKKSKEITVTHQGELLITLDTASENIEEVVVVGYDTQKKANLTGSVASIGGERLENRAVPTLTQALQGVIANLNISTSNGAPGTKQNINIRGYTGINIDDNGNKSNVAGSPLIVIDGIQGGDLSSINSNDIENISVLKDAASAAIYGSSAPFGVIIITTKKGQAGATTVRYNNNFGAGQPLGLPKFVNSLDFANAFNEVAANSNYPAKLFQDDVIQRIKDYQAGILKDETIKDPNGDSWLGWNSANANNDWFFIYMKKFSFSQQHNLGISGGSEKSKYYVGLGYNQQDGLYNYAKDVYKRYNIRSNITTKINPWLSFNFRSALSRAQTDNPTVYSNISGGRNYSYDYLHEIGRAYPTVPLKNPDGYWSTGSGVGIFTDGGRQKATTDNAIVTGEFVVNLLSNWNVTANYTYDGTYIDDSNHRKTFYIVNPSGLKEARGGTSPNYFERSSTKNQHHTINLFSSYERKVGEHYFKLLAGYTQELYDNLRLSGSNDNLYSDEVPMVSLSYGANRNAMDQASQLAIRGGFGRINYNYKEKYLVELNGRYDGTSRFLKDVRYKFYPGVSAAWIISKEPFWAPIQRHVNQFKIRGSYASLGDQGFTDNYYPFYPSLGTSTPSQTGWIFNGGRESAVGTPGLVNYDLTWITINTLGFGTDIELLNNRLTLTFDWYKRQAKNFVSFGEKLPAILGTNAPRINDAETETKGIELSIGWKDKIQDFTYGANLVFSDYKGSVKKFNNPTKLISDMWYDGMTMGEIWGFETEGLFQSQEEINSVDQSFIHANWYLGDVHYKDLNGDGKVDIGNNTIDNPGDRRIIGNSTPRYSFGLNMHGAYRDFDLSIFLQGVGKRDMMFDANSNYFWGFTDGQWQSSYFTAHTNRWTAENPNGYYPRAYFNTDKNRRAQSGYLQNAAYLRIKNLQLGYSLPKQITDKIRFQKTRFFFSVENLATITNLMKIVDPEIVSEDAKSYPLQRTWAFGINLTF